MLEFDLNVRYSNPNYCNMVTCSTDRLVDGDVMMTVDIGMCGSEDQSKLEPLIRDLVESGVIGRFRSSELGFEMRSIGVDPDRPECGELLTTMVYRKSEACERLRLTLNKNSTCLM